VLNNADAVIAASTATFNEVHNIVDNAEKIHFIPNGVDLQRFNPNINFAYLREKLGFSKGVVIFTLRSHEPVYGLEYFIKAASIVAEQRSNVFFVIGGDGSLKKYHEKLAEELGLSKKMIFTGRISRDEVPYYYCLSDVVVVPSVQEAFGITVSEAMACGKPVIGSNLGGIRDQIVDGHTGFLIEPRNPLKIAEKILLLADNPEEAKRLGLNGRRLVEEKFDVEKRIDRIISVYNKVLMQ
jgi:glycosyltransferase involved in cell wall biosynthesis